MKRKDDLVAVLGLSAIAAALALLATACDSPFKADGGGESTPAEDDAVIAPYTQTVNQSSQDTTVAPNVRVDGNNNNITIIYGDRNDPAVNPAPELYPASGGAAADTEEASEPAAP